MPIAAMFRVQGFDATGASAIASPTKAGALPAQKQRSPLVSFALLSHYPSPPLLLCVSAYAQPVDEQRHETKEERDAKVAVCTSV
jgi:hypothetical protein